MLARLREMPLVPILLQQRQQGGNGFLYTADHTDIDGSTASNVLCPDIDMSDADPCPLRIELSIWKIGPKHQQHIAVEHRVVTR